MNSEDLLHFDNHSGRGVPIIYLELSNFESHKGK